MNNQRHSLRCV